MCFILHSKYSIQKLLKKAVMFFEDLEVDESVSNTKQEKAVLVL